MGRWADARLQLLRSLLAGHGNPGYFASKRQDLKRFSIYNLYQECNLRGQGLAFNSVTWIKWTIAIKAWGLLLDVCPCVFALLRRCCLERRMMKCFLFLSPVPTQRSIKSSRTSAAKRVFVSTLRGFTIQICFTVVKHLLRIDKDALVSRFLAAKSVLESATHSDELLFLFPTS